MKAKYKIVITAFIAFSICYSYAYFVKSGFKKYNFHINTQFYELFTHKTNIARDIIFIGSSRAHLGINPKIIDSVCNTNSYNAAMNGASIFEFYYTLKAYLVNNPPPKNLVLTLDFFSFRLDNTTFYYPIYINYVNNPEIEEMISQRGYQHLLYKLVPFIFLKDLDDNAKGYAVKGFKGINDIPKGDFQYNGFLSNTDEILKKDTVARTSDYIINRSSLKYLDQIIKVCKNENIRLIFNYTPEYNFTCQNTSKHGKQTIAYITSVARINKLPYMHGDSLALCKNKMYFANVGHLNKLGADVYSAVLARQLKSLISAKH